MIDIDFVEAEMFVPIGIGTRKYVNVRSMNASMKLKTGDAQRLWVSKERGSGKPSERRSRNTVLNY